MENGYSCRTKACIGVIQLSKDLRTAFVYRSRTLSVLCWTQVALGLISTSVYVFLHAHLNLKPFETSTEFSYSSSSLALGSIVGTFEMFSGIITLLAFQEPNYCWLHLAMALHIVHVLGQFLLSMSSLFSLIPGKEFHNPAEGAEIGTCLWGQSVCSILNWMALLSVLIGSFFVAATGYGVCCEMEGGEKRKSSVDLNKLRRRRELRERKLVKFKSFQPTNVAQNLDFTQEVLNNGSLEQCSSPGVNDDGSLMFVNRHAQTRERDLPSYQQSSIKM